MICEKCNQSDTIISVPHSRSRHRNNSHLCLGTNLAIHDALLTTTSGHLLESQGAILPALPAIGLNKKECLRTKKPFRKAHSQFGNN
jgi:hypothetical protein